MTTRIFPRRPRLLLFLLCTFFLLWPKPSPARSLWQWQLALQTKPAQKVLNMPITLFIDAKKERYYVADSGNNRLVSFDRNGAFLNAFTAKDSLDHPIDQVRTPDGILWVVEAGRNSLTRIDLKGRKTTRHQLRDRNRPVFPGRIEAAGQLLFVSDRNSGDILAYNEDLTVAGRFTCPDQGGFLDFKVTDDSLWALSGVSKRVYAFARDGRLRTTLDLSQWLRFPYSLALGPDGLLYLLDRHRGQVAVFSRTGQPRYTFLESGQGRGALYYPAEIRFDPWGRLCIVNEGNGRVEILAR